MAEQDTPPPTITAMKIPIIKKGEYDIWSMRMRQYICHTDHNLWDIIVDGDLQEEAAPAGEQPGPPAPKTAKQLTAKRNQERVKSILLLAIPDEYLLKFHNVPDAKSLWAAIKSRFGGNDESKKMQRNVLKHQFENFTTAPNESLDKAYDRFQKLISQLEVHAAPVSKEDINQKFLRSLPPSWSQIALIMRNKPDIDQIDIDDLYNNLRVYEDEMKRSSSSTSNSQNLAFLSSENTSSTNEVSTVSGDFGVSTAGGTSSSSQVSSTPCADEVMCSFFAQQTTSPQLENEDLQQINEDDLEELDLRWQVAMECKSGRNQGKRSYGDNGRRNAPTNESSSQALVAQDGLGGYDWSNDFDVGPVNYALMAISSSSSSSSSDNEVQNCSKQCLESFKTLQKNFDSEREKHSRARLEIQGYELALESLESRIIRHEKNELAWGENMNELKVKIEKWEESSKSLNKILNSQMSANDKKGLGYGTLLNEINNKSETDSEISMSVLRSGQVMKRSHQQMIGLDEYAIRKKIIESKTTELNTDTSKSKTSETVDDEDDVSAVKTVSPVKTNEAQTVRNQVDKIGQIPHKEGIRFKKIKACFVCKSTDHLIKDCDFYDKKSPEPKLKSVVNTGQRVIKPVWDNAKRVNQQILLNNLKYPQARRTFVLSGVLTRTSLVNPVRPNGKRAVHTVSTARPISTARPVSTARPFAPKIAQTGSAIRPIYPRMDNVRPRASYSPIKRSYYTKPAFRPKNLKQDVKTSRVKNMTTAGTRAVVNTGKGKMNNSLKKSKWVWRPKGNYMDHESKEKGSFILTWYAFSHNPTIYDSLVKQFWHTTIVRTLANGIQELVASVDNKEYTITEAFIRSQLQLADATGVAEDQELPHSSPPRSIDRQNTEGAATTTSGLNVGMDSGNIHESPLRSHETPLPEGNTSRSVKDSLQLKELMAIVPKMVTKIDILEKELKETKQTLGHVVLTLVKKVKSLEVDLMRISKRVILSDSEDEETENQGRKIQDIDDDPLVSLVRESMKEKEVDFASHTKASASGEAQKEDIRVNTSNTPVSTPSVVQIVNVIVPSLVKNQREGKAPMTSEDDARQVHLDALLAKRIQEEQELFEQQHKRKVEVQEATPFYTKEDWDTIRAKIEANAELTKSLQ
ncbi:hypothetical protein Tco_0537740 [Tanacetum coccineum]